MLAPGLGKAADEDVVGRIEEDDTIGNPLAIERAQLIEQVAENLFAANIEDERDLVQAAAARTQFRKFWDEAGRQVVDAKIAQIFEHFCGLALAGARKAGND